MDDHLVGYLLNSLDPVTHQRVEAYLHGHPEARTRLDLLEEALTPLRDEGDIAPPPGLVYGTLARISEYRCALPVAPLSSPHQHDLLPRRWGRPIDWMVAAVLLVLVGGLVMPLLARHWREQRRLACENNLRKFWVGLQGYADRTDNDFPRVEAEGSRTASRASSFPPSPIADCSKTSASTAPPRVNANRSCIRSLTWIRFIATCRIRSVSSRTTLPAITLTALAMKTARCSVASAATPATACRSWPTVPGPMPSTAATTAERGKTSSMSEATSAGAFSRTLVLTAITFTTTARAASCAGVCETDTVLGSSGARP